MSSNVSTPYLESECAEITARCPRFDRCDANACPFDLNTHDRHGLPGEPSCALPKATRMRIANGTPLPMRGMTVKEFAGFKAWQGLSSEEKAKRVERLKQGSRPHRFKAHRGPNSAQKVDLHTAVRSNSPQARGEVVTAPIRCGNVDFVGSRRTR